jgi:hypothetical protein
MDLTPYIDSVRRELVMVAETGSDEFRDLAERLWAPLDSMTRLAMLEALSAAADEITGELAPGSVEVRLRGRDPEFVVTPPPADRPVQEAPPSAPSAPSTPGDDEEAGTTRLTLRLPNHLKPGIDEAAARAGLSVNAWLVRAVAAALQPAAEPRRGAPFGQRYSGWVR